MYALEETSWDVHAAIKLTKLKQLLSTQPTNIDKHQCKQALIQNSWDVERAARYLTGEGDDQEEGHSNTRSGRDSPEFVHV